MATISGLSNGVNWSTIALVPGNFASRIHDIDLRFDQLEAAAFNATPISASDTQIKASVLGGTITIKGSSLLSSPTVTSVTWSRSGGDGFSLKGSMKYDSDGDLKSGKVTSATYKEDGEAITMTGSVTVTSSGSYSGKVTKLAWNEDGNSYTATGSFTVSGNGFSLPTVTGTATGFTVKTAGGESLTITGVSMSLTELNAVTDVGDLLALLPAELTGNDTISFTTDGTALLNGGAGDDVYVVTSPTQTVAESPGQGTDTVRIAYDTVGSIVELADFTEVENLEVTGKGPFGLTGTAANNLLKGNASSNQIDGGAGADTMIGGKGSDVYFVDNAGDTVTEKLDAGNDTVSSSVSATLAPNVESLLLTGTDAIDGTGNNLKNLITGNSAANVLTGLKGNDEYILQSAADQVVEASGGGTDTVFVMFDYTLPDFVERVRVNDGAGHVLTGNALANRMTGGGANDTLDGGAGNDTLIGGGGNDLYFVDRSGDVVTEGAGMGTDKVVASVSHKLAANVDNLELAGAALNGTGNRLDNQIVGNALNNKLNGSTGNDTLTGGDGDDQFIFSSKLNGLTNVDTITDFFVGVDRLVLDNDIFTRIGAAGMLAGSRFLSGDGVTEATAAGQRLIYDSASGDLYYDSNGNAAGGKVKIAVLEGAVDLGATDILVVE